MTDDEKSDTIGASNAAPTATPRRYEWTELGRPSTAVVEGVAAATGRRPGNVVPEDGHVDPDALDALLTSVRDGDGDDGDVSVSFTLGEVDVAIDSDGTLEVWPDGADPGRGDAPPRSDSELNDRIGRVFGAAFASGVDVLGGWVIRNEDGLPDWDVHVTETAKPREAGVSAALRSDVRTD